MGISRSKNSSMKISWLMGNPINVPPAFLPDYPAPSGKRRHLKGLQFPSSPLWKALFENRGEAKYLLGPLSTRYTQCHPRPILPCFYSSLAPLRSIVETIMMRCPLERHKTIAGRKIHQSYFSNASCCRVVSICICKGSSCMPLSRYRRRTSKSRDGRRKNKE